MQQNKLFDVIILGASVEGIALAEYIKTKSPEMAVALVSKHFNFVKQTNKLMDTELILAESVYSRYNHGLIIISLKDGSIIVGKSLVIATGGQAIKAPVDKLKNKNICYNPREITVKPKNKPAVVCGNGKDAVNFALTMAKKFKYVYLCSNTLKLDCTTKLIKKLNNTPNIVHLPNCYITSCKNDKEGNLQEVTLSTYDTIKCAALVFAFGRKPQVSGIDLKMIELDDNKYVKVNATNQTTRVSNIYAIGECVHNNTKRSITAVGNSLIGGNLC